MTKMNWATGVLSAVMVTIGDGCAEGGDTPSQQGGDDVPFREVSGDQVPIFAPDPLFFSVIPNQWVSGAVGGIAVDSRDNT